MVEKQSNYSLCHGLINREHYTDGYDLADYLISEQNEINENNEFIDTYNSKLEKLLKDSDLLAQFNSILDEQKAILIIDAGLSEAEAETIISNTENYQRIIISL